MSPTSPTSPLNPGSMDHHMAATLRMRGYLPRFGRGYRRVAWQEIQRALHAGDAACTWLVAHFYKPGQVHWREALRILEARVVQWGVVKEPS